MVQNRLRLYIFHEDFDVTTTCSTDELELLQNCVGKRLQKIVLQKYPDQSVYGRILLYFDDNTVLLVELRSHDIEYKFEVFVIKIRVYDGENDEWPFGSDELVFHNFLISRFNTIRRDELIVQNESGQPKKHEVETIRSAKLLRSEPVLTDVGLTVVSSRGDVLSWQADDFPLVFQFKYQTENFTPIL